MAGSSPRKSARKSDKAKKAPRIKEKRIEILACRFLATIGIFCFKIDRQGTYDPKLKTFRKNLNPFKIKGVSDILAILPDGRFLAVEIKASKGVLSVAQESFLQTVNERNGVGIYVYSVKELWDDLQGVYDFESHIKSRALQFLDNSPF